MLFTSMLLAAAAASPVLQPTGAWDVKQEKTSCRLQTQYASGGKPVFVSIAAAPQDQDETISIEDSAAIEKPTSGMYVTGISSKSAPNTGVFVSQPSERTGYRLTALLMQGGLLTDLEDGDVVDISAKPVRLRLQFYGIAEAEKALADCKVSLRKSWGVGNDTPFQPMSALDRDITEYYTTGDYPAEDREQGVAGLVVSILDVDTQGRVAACRTISSSAVALNAGTYLASAKLRFKPARDKNGEAVSSAFVSSVRWTLPGR